MVTLPLTLAALLGIPPAGLAGIGFLVLVIALWVFAARNAGKRAEQLALMMPSLGYQPVVESSAEDLLPDLVLHPNGFESMRAGSDLHSVMKDLRLTVLNAWVGRLGSLDVTLMHISVLRKRFSPGRVSDINNNLNATTIRCDLNGTSAAPSSRVPPDFLIEESLLFKKKAKRSRAVNGPAQMGEHYFLFSDATDDELEPWVSKDLRDQLAQFRLWTIATHGGIVYLTRDTKYPVKPADLPEFLQEGEALLAGMSGVG